MAVSCRAAVHSVRIDRDDLAWLKSTTAAVIFNPGWKVTVYDVGGSYEVAFVHGQHLLTAGTYVLTAAEPVGGPTLRLPLHAQRFVLGTTWVNWPTSPFGNWSHNEDFGTGFQKTYELSLLQGEQPIFADGFEGVAAPVQPGRAFSSVRRAPPAIVGGKPTREVPPVQFAPRTR